MRCTCTVHPYDMLAFPAQSPHRMTIIYLFVAYYLPLSFVVACSLLGPDLAICTISVYSRILIPPASYVCSS